MEPVVLAVLFTSLPSKDAAKTLVMQLLEKRAVACAKIFPTVTSYYWWEGEIGESEESLVMCKFPASSSAKLRELVESLHPYEIPEILILRVDEVNSKYAKWAVDETTT